MSPIRMSHAESGVRAVNAFVQAFNRHDVAAITALLGDPCVYESPEPAPDGTRAEGREAVGAAYAKLFATRPGVRLAAEEVIGFGLHCMLRWTQTWDDGAAHRLRGADLIAIRDGRIGAFYSYVKAGRQT